MLDTVTLSLTTDGAGAGVISSDLNCLGTVKAVGVIIALAADTVVFTVECVPIIGAPIPILVYTPTNHTNVWKYPRPLSHKADGTDQAAGIVNEVPLIGKIRLTVASGGATKLIKAVVIFDNHAIGA